MSFNFRNSSGGLGSLVGLGWNAFQMAATSSKLIPIVPPNFVVRLLSTTGVGSQINAATSYTFGVNGDGGSPNNVPAWLIPGCSVSINVTVGGIPIIFNGVVKDVADGGVSFTVSPNSQSGIGITTNYSNQPLDTVSGSVVNSITLNIVCQKAMFQVASGAGGNVTIAPVADANGANAPYSVTLTAGGQEYEVTAPTGGKFDLSDWYCQSSSGTVDLSVRFL